ncbi:MAG: protein-L-isoaspartate O-methyltransferase [Pseudomonadota bacterium]
MNTEFARQQMIQQQVRAWDVFSSRVLDVLQTTPRERFVPAVYEALAFAETEIPIGHGETMLTPVIEGRILEALEIQPGDRILEVGTGTGFLTACLAKLGASVTSLDIHPEFLADARKTLEELGIDNVEFLQMDATRELPDARFDAIAVSGSLEAFDTRYTEILKPGGRLFVVTGNAPAMAARIVTLKDDAEWSSEVLFETSLRRLTNGALPPLFLF